MNVTHGMLMTLLGALSLTRLAAQEETRTAPPPAPAAWPATLQLGMADDPGDAATLQAAAPFGFRYAYLSSGVNTGSGWSTWNSPAGAYANLYINESITHHVTPMFVYYQLLQSNPQVTGDTEEQLDLAHFQNLSTMTSWFADFTLLLQQCHDYPSSTVVIDVEPDFWAYMEQETTADAGDPTTVTGEVGACGGDVAAFANNVSGLAQAIKHLRDLYAPNVIFGFDAEDWGTNWSLLASLPKATAAKAAALGVQSGTYFNNLATNFDVLFASFSDRDAGYYQIVKGETGAWYQTLDFQNFATFLANASTTANKRVVMWQTPEGNTKTLSCNNSWGHYQSNYAEWLLNDPSRANLQSYLDAGVIGIFFGAGATGCTVASDGDGDGITNFTAVSDSQSTDGSPTSIASISAPAGTAPVLNATSQTLTTPFAADDDGGYLKYLAYQYYHIGVMPLAVGAGTSGTTSATTTSGGTGSGTGGSSSAGTTTGSVATSSGSHGGGCGLGGGGIGLLGLVLAGMRNRNLRYRLSQVGRGSVARMPKWISS
jgi:hypothetical protein